MDVNEAFSGTASNWSQVLDRSVTSSTITHTFCWAFFHFAKLPLPPSPTPHTPTRHSSGSKIYSWDRRRCLLRKTARGWEEGFQRMAVHPQHCIVPPTTSHKKKKNKEVVNLGHGGPGLHGASPGENFTRKENEDNSEEITSSSGKGMRRGVASCCLWLPLHLKNKSHA